MDALIFPTYDSKHDTSITMNDLDFDTISKIIFPIGSIYPCFDKNIDPNTFLYGKWDKCQDDGYFIYSDTQRGKSDEEGIETIEQYTGATTLTLSQIRNHSHYFVISCGKVDLKSRRLSWIIHVGPMESLEVLKTERFLVLMAEE